MGPSPKPSLTLLAMLGCLANAFANKAIWVSFLNIDNMDCHRFRFDIKKLWEAVSLFHKSLSFNSCWYDNRHIRKQARLSEVYS